MTGRAGPCERRGLAMVDSLVEDLRRASRDAAGPGDARDARAAQVYRGSHRPRAMNARVPGCGALPCPDLVSDTARRRCYPPRAVPYRGLPSSAIPTAMPTHCEICGRHADAERCAQCHVVARHLAVLELPVVVVKFDWDRGTAILGLGMVLVDRWREIARCRCRFEVTSARGLDVIARGHAEFWAPRARDVCHPEEVDVALEATLRRTRAEHDREVRRCFLAAQLLAPQMALDARVNRYYFSTVGTKLVAAEFGDAEQEY